MDAALVRCLRDFYEAYERGDVDAMLEGVHADVTLINPDYAIDGGIRHGHEGMRAAFTSLHDQFDYERIEIERLEEGPDVEFLWLRTLEEGRRAVGLA
jgi:ketosteroid isomerase-like protein